MSDDRYDDGLVHSHGWADHSRHIDARFMAGPARQIADVSNVRVPSTVHQDEHILPG